MKNREIKFRAWQDSTMLHIPLNTNYGITRFFGLLYEDTIIMQYTGLKDKNGVEICECDVVKYTNPYSKCTYTHIVRWDEKWAAFGLFEKSNEWCKESDWAKIRDVEVLGNIYENPELIK